MPALFGDRANGRRLAVGLIAIAILLVVDVVLVALALRAHDAPESPPVPTSSLHPLPSESSSIEPQPEPSESAAPTGLRLLSAVSSTVAWRAEAGACGQQGSVELTTDGGRTWAPSTLDPAGPVLALEPNADGRRGLVVVADAGCEPIVQRTFTGGLGWELAPDQAVGSYVTPQGDVTLDGTSIDAPCEEPQAATASGGGVVLCAGVAQARTSSGGWVPVAQDVTAIGPADGGVAVALRSAEGCEGITVGVIRAGALQSVCTDIPTDVPIAVSEGGTDQVWAWVGDLLEVVEL